MVAFTWGCLVIKMTLTHHTHLFLLLALCGFSDVWGRTGKNMNTFCHWSTADTSGQVHHTFLRSTGAPRRLLLYHSTFRPDGHRLAHCTVRDEPYVTQGYLESCRAGNRLRFSAPLLNANVSATCRLDTGRRKRDVPRQDSQTQSQRKKQGWIFPGTLWCGSGNKAKSYEDLGHFVDTDKCCREHDHCQHTIGSYQSLYGTLNSNYFTVSHCDCDRRFYQCLLGVNDTVSNMVGIGFFNLLKVPCFVLREKCDGTGGLGMCKADQVTHQATFRDALVYNITHPPPEYKDTGLTQSVLPTHTNRSSTLEPKGPVNTPPNPETPTITAQTEVTPNETVNISTALSSIPSHSGRNHSDFENTLPTLPLWTAEKDSGNHLPPVHGVRHKGKPRPCSCYRLLDRCPLKIAPGEEQFGLQNLDSKTLYHCNCTRRLARQLRHSEDVNSIQPLLLDFVSLYCFREASHQECPTGKNCPAIISKPRHIQKILKREDKVERWKDLALVSNIKVKRQDVQSSKRRRAPATLYRQCLRMVASRIPKGHETSVR